MALVQRSETAQSFTKRTLFRGRRVVFFHIVLLKNTKFRQKYVNIIQV